MGASSSADLAAPECVLARHRHNVIKADRTRVECHQKAQSSKYQSTSLTVTKPHRCQLVCWSQGLRRNHFQCMLSEMSLVHNNLIGFDCVPIIYHHKYKRYLCI